MAYIPNEMPEVSFVLMICHACGPKDNVVKTAAMNPITIFSPYRYRCATQMTSETATFFYNSIIMDSGPKTITSGHSVTPFTNFLFFCSGLSNNIHKYDRIVLRFRNI